MKSKLRIIWVSKSRLDSHLHVTTQLEILLNLGKRGNPTLLVAMTSKGNVRSRQLNKGASRFSIVLVPIRYFPILSSMIYAAVATVLLPIHILKFNPNFVILEPDFSVMSIIPSIILSKLRKTKLILDVRSVPVDIDCFRASIKKFWYQVSIQISKKLFSGITTITPMMKEEICNQFSITPSRVGIWSSGVSATLFDPVNWQNKGNELKHKLGLSGRFIVFYHGFIPANRGIKETLNALMIIAERRSDIMLFFLGSGPFVPDLKLLIKRMNLEDKVIIHDSVNYEQVPAFISMSDVCIIPLPNYPCWRPQSPLKLFEYLSMEKVVIVTDIPAHRFVIGSERCGIYAKSSDPIDIANAMEFAYSNKECLASWGIVGRSIVEEKYTWDALAKNLEYYLLSLSYM